MASDVRLGLCRVVPVLGEVTGELVGLAVSFLETPNFSETLMEEVLRGGTGRSLDSFSLAAFLFVLSTEAGIVALPPAPLTNELAVGVGLDILREGEESPGLVGGLVVLAVGVESVDVEVGDVTAFGLLGRVSLAVMAAAVGLDAADALLFVGVLAPELARLAVLLFVLLVVIAFLVLVGSAVDFTGLGLLGGFLLVVVVVGRGDRAPETLEVVRLGGVGRICFWTSTGRSLMGVSVV